MAFPKLWLRLAVWEPLRDFWQPNVRIHYSIFLVESSCPLLVFLRRKPGGALYQYHCHVSEKYFDARHWSALDVSGVGDRRDLLTDCRPDKVSSQGEFIELCLERVKKKKRKRSIRILLMQRRIMKSKKV